mmetsp:Transcript_18198/g.58526  ORF Transcript_18198/g.58526 Transcript_18198/m.58526 type:complete len:289 (+) Transcript_18198:494-1360(+)
MFGWLTLERIISSSSACHAWPETVRTRCTAIGVPLGRTPRYVSHVSRCPSRTAGLHPLHAAVSDAIVKAPDPTAGAAATEGAGDEYRDASGSECGRPGGGRPGGRSPAGCGAGGRGGGVTVFGGRAGATGSTLAGLGGPSAAGTHGVGPLSGAETTEEEVDGVGDAARISSTVPPPAAPTATAAASSAATSSGSRSCLASVTCSASEPWPSSPRMAFICSIAPFAHASSGPSPAGSRPRMSAKCLTCSKSSPACSSAPSAFRVSAGAGGGARAALSDGQLPFSALACL